MERGADRGGRRQQQRPRGWQGAGATKPRVHQQQRDRGRVGHPREPAGPEPQVVGDAACVARRTHQQDVEAHGRREDAAGHATRDRDRSRDLDADLAGRQRLWRPDGPVVLHVGKVVDGADGDLEREHREGQDQRRPGRCRRPAPRAPRPRARPARTGTGGGSRAPRQGGPAGGLAAVTVGLPVRRVASAAGHGRPADRNEVATGA